MTAEGHSSRGTQCVLVWDHARVRGHRNVDADVVRMALCHDSGMEFALRRHAGSDGTPLDEQRTGLDHREFVVAELTDVTAWAQRYGRSSERSS
jgi:hypothetical protein